MKKTIALIVLATAFLACTNSKQSSDSKKGESNINNLLPQEVIVYNEINYTTHELEEWVQGVDQTYMQGLNRSVIDSDVELYSANINYSPKNNFIISDSDIEANIMKNGAINALYFVEKWSFNEENYTFNKEIYSWSPVLEYYKTVEGAVDSANLVKKLLYDLKGDFKGNEKLIAKNIIYEVNFNTERENSEYLDVEKLNSLIINPVIEGEKKAYDFFDKTEKAILEIKKSLGYRIDSIEIEDIQTGEFEMMYEETAFDYSSVLAYVFVEDWFIDTKTFMIEKRIKSISPVSITTRIDTDGDAYQVKKILFTVDLQSDLENNKTNEKSNIIR